MPLSSAWFVVGFAIFLIGVTKSGFGSGMGLIVVPLTALGLAQLPQGEKAALGLLLPLLLVGDLIAVSQYRKLLNASLLRRLAMPTLVGVGLGSLLLLGIQRIGGRSEPLANALIRLEIGVESVVLVSLHYYTRWRSAGRGRKLLPEPLRSMLAGSYSGVSSTLAHAAGPVIALYLLPLKLPREAYVGTCAVYFAALNAAKLPAYYATGLFNQISPSFALAWLPCVLAGALVGRWLVKRIPDRLFMNIVYGTTFIMGIYLVADAALRLIKLRG